MKKFWLLVIAVLFLVFLSGCSPNENPLIEEVASLRERVETIENEKEDILFELNEKHRIANENTNLLETRILELEIEIAYLKGKRYIELSRNNVATIIYTSVADNTQKQYSIKANPEVKSLYIDLWDYTINIFYNSAGSEYVIVLNYAYSVINFRT